MNSENLPKTNGHKSEFSLEDCFAYVKICETKGEPVKNAKGLASHLYKTGEADAFILAALHPEKSREKELEIYGEPRRFYRRALHSLLRLKNGSSRRTRRETLPELQKRKRTQHRQTA